MLACHGFTLSAHTMTDAPVQHGIPRGRRVAISTPSSASWCGGTSRHDPTDNSPTDNAPEGRVQVGLADIPESTDVLVIGLGITGAGVALDAASRGLSVVAVDAHDVAFGTSRWSSKLVHGGLRYLAKGQVDVAHESAVERGILMETTAPHLIRALPMLMPLTPEISRFQAALARGRHPRGRPAPAGCTDPSRDAARDRDASARPRR